MHMSDALLSPAVGAGMWAATAVAVGVAARRVARRADERLTPVMAVLGAFVFAAQMINFTIPGTGSSGHLVGALLLAILLGPDAALLAMTSVLVVQALFFADGGLIALGANIFNMAVLSCYLVYPLVYRPLRHHGRLAVFVAAIAALQLGALGVVLETTASGISDLPFIAFAAAMQPIHLAIGVVEALVTVAVLQFVARARPGLWQGDAERGLPRPILAGFLVVTVLVGGGLSWLASEHPDGLEWSVARVGAEPLLQQSGTVAEVQRRIAPMPDYAQAGVDEAPSWGTPNLDTTLAGLLGGTLTLGLTALLGWGLRRRTQQQS